MAEKEKGAALRTDTPKTGEVFSNAKVVKNPILEKFFTKNFGYSMDKLLKQIDAFAELNNSNCVILSMCKEVNEEEVKETNPELEEIKASIMADSKMLQHRRANEEAQWEIDVTEDYPEPSYLVEGEGIGSIPRGDIIALKAKSKNGKTFLASIFAATILGASWGQLRGREGGCKVTYVDTEQNTPNVARVGRRIHQLCGWSLNQKNQRLTIFALRQMEMAKRLPFIEKKVEENTPDCLIIDGIADLISDFNDISTSNAIIGNLMQLSAKKNMAIIFVLHTNKGKDDSNMKGHLGTLAVQKCSDVFAVEKVGEIFNVKETECRNLPLRDFSFSLDENGLPIPGKTQAEERGERQKADTRTRMKTEFENIFNQQRNDVLKYNVLKELLSESKSKTTAERWINQAEKLGIIIQNGNGYSLNKN